MRVWPSLRWHCGHRQRATRFGLSRTQASTPMKAAPSPFDTMWHFLHSDKHEPSQANLSAKSAPSPAPNSNRPCPHISLTSSSISPISPPKVMDDPPPGTGETSVPELPTHHYPPFVKLHNQDRLRPLENSQNRSLVSLLCLSLLWREEVDRHKVGSCERPTRGWGPVCGRHGHQRLS